ncbi:RagB/SusD family nutrient uptake outer membrane protein [Mangrovibacterium lignilyticum]|uniref:RagB/SusD family nutrient uptake outer membrane protein n=1 Tax=Mangrovibacterium lignilyticum TaxID=2668052 RepID=UPI0013D568C1|nr:RagB/SusD family nutrient uptake outer membrane protein [Mangrovibacterium lignilyticum]
MKILKKIIIGLLAIVAMASCTLEREDYTEISPDNFPQSENDLKLAVNSLYYEFTTGTWNGEAIFGSDQNGYQVVSDMTTDCLWSCWGWGWDELHFQQWFSTISGTTQSQAYNAFAHYQFLSKARNTIRRIEESIAPESAKTLYAAEAHALRGWIGLYLYDMFGPVPVASDEVLDDPETFVYLPRLTDEEYDLMMETDLRAAIADLPVVASARGRMTQGAAMMILMKYYLIRSNFSGAEELARELQEMEGSVYSLQPDYANVFSKAGIGNNEIILQVPCNSSANWTTNYLTASVLPSDMPWTEKSQGWGGYVMPWNFYDSFEADDARRALIAASYTNNKGELMTSTNSTQLSYGALPLKYGKDPEMTGANSGIDVVVYRYSDVLLTLAECIVRNTGAVSTEAIQLVNRVRNRAGLAELSAEQVASTDAFMDALLIERGHEFWLEGLRRQDLIRFGKYVEYANQRIAEANASGKNYFTVDESHNRFWIPQTFIDESKSQIKQNSGY